MSEVQRAPSKTRKNDTCGIYGFAWRIFNIFNWRCLKYENEKKTEISTQRLETQSMVWFILDTIRKFNLILCCLWNPSKRLDEILKALNPSSQFLGPWDRHIFSIFSTNLYRPICSYRLRDRLKTISKKHWQGMIESKPSVFRTLLHIEWSHWVKFIHVQSKITHHPFSNGRILDDLLSKPPLPRVSLIGHHPSCWLFFTAMAMFSDTQGSSKGSACLRTLQQYVEYVYAYVYWIPINI